jgi:hypothetical protein
MRKALLLVAVIISFASITHAQITKGRILLGGTLAYGRSTGYNPPNVSDPQVQQGLTINPSFGKAVKDNLILGIEASFYSLTQKYRSSTIISKYRSQSYGGSIFLRQYVPILKQFYFYAQAAAGANKNRTWQTSNDQTLNDTQGWGASLNLTPGLTYAITKRLYVETGLNGFALLSYNHSKTKFTDSNSGTVSTAKGSNFGISTSLGSSSGLNIGFRLLL